ncbi:MAG: sporulation protein YhbH [Steroidobacteraceae bacterium]
MDSDRGKRDGEGGAGKWYELFSRGARDWLRHDEKIRAAVKGNLPDIIAGADLANDNARTVRVPVRMLEHHHFRLRRADESQGAGQGKARPGDVFSDPAKAGQGEKGPGGREQGEVQLLLEFKVDDIVEWLWEEMQLPNLKPRAGPSDESDWTREGWDRRGARSRLDRRRSFKEMVKRRAAPGATPTFTDEDLRYRQLARRRQPAVHAVVFFMLDVSGSMSDRDRKLAKTFFFWVVQGLRREYRSLETVFVGHTTEAWEFTEPEFLQVTGSGGTVASTGFNKVREIIDARYNPARSNIYLFYATDGDNSVSDAAEARTALATVSADACFTGYVEVSSGLSRQLATETGRMFAELQAAGCAAGSYALADFDAVWGAVRHFFTTENEAQTQS